MNKYEIVIMLDPAENIEKAQSLLKSTFKSGVEKFEKLEFTKLAYEINKSKVAQYVLAIVNSQGKEEINEFVRKANITKTFWRHMIINLTSEKGINKPAKPKKTFKKPFVARKFSRDDESKTHSTEEPRRANTKSTYKKSTSFSQDNKNKK
ncbi:30S ribosomal protein S6 [Mycoplasmopsis pulmonis]|uniref:30S ribosomal protein S6 n=1 Tax=Mycoplasmopsis pulmonis TaxID=2107 RepID=UPI001004E11F|nr:30S ribosomal protein S6 [Mycoplasmopsis pulmonis]MDZ7293588.1 30S ribosomal protein S6 [Mycoplasmopsis pulmonis]VEU68372.1 30S ribosomal protein S6 [Mycoplasmopsis pulmonis]